MGRMLGSPAAHESLDRMMASMMGSRGRVADRTAPCEREPGALDMLAKRIARGELSAEEYSKTKRLLEGGQR